MDVAALAQTVLGGRTEAAFADAQVSVLKKSLDAEGQAVSRLIESMALPLATEGRVGTLINAYA